MPTYEAKPPIKPSTACRLKWKGRDGKMYRYRRRENPSLRISVTSYVGGFAIGAMHYYGRVTGDTPDTYCIDTGESFAMGGYGDDKPELYGVFEFDGKRVLTEPEYDLADELVGDVGDTTGRHNTPEEAFEAAVTTARENFADNAKSFWIVEFEYCGPQLECPRTFRLSDLEDPELLKKFEWEG